MARTTLARDWRHFDTIPRDLPGGALYAAELSNAVVKVGQSTSPRTRLISLTHYVKLTMDADLGRFIVGPAAGDDMARLDLECKLIARLRQMARPYRGRREFYEGVTFDVVAALVQEVSAAGCDSERRNG